LSVSIVTTPEVLVGNLFVQTILLGIQYLMLVLRDTTLISFWWVVHKFDILFCLDPNNKCSSFRDDLVSVWINSFWMGGNEGHVIIVPNEHFETLYELPDDVEHRIFEVSKK